MPLTLAIHPITEICFGKRLDLEGKRLVVDAAELSRLILEDGAIEAVDFQIARPGESCRAGPIFDIVEPRAKAPGGSPDWPGIIGPPQTAGSGTTHVLSGAAVTALREESPGDSRGATGYVLEMSGAAATGSRYAALHHLIVIPHTRGDLPIHSRHKAYRCGAIESRRAFGAGGFRQVTRARGDLRACRRQATEAGCRESLISGKFFHARESRKPMNRLFTARTPTACCQLCCIRMNGSMAQS